MSKLGGNSPSADTDKSNNLEGSDGAPGDTPFIQGGTWHIGAVDTGVVAEGTDGTDGVNPNIDAGGNWFVDGVDTGVKAAGEDGLDGEGSGIVVTVEAGTGCTVDASDPASPIVNVTVVGGGQVDSVVAGTNVDSIDNTDPVNPIINVATQAGDPSPLTTKGDLYGYDTGDERIPVGTNDQVLTADSTVALGLSWKDAAAGGGGESQQLRQYESMGMDPANGPSTSANATKGMWCDVFTDISIHSIAVGIESGANETYRLFVAKEAATPFEIDSIIATSETTYGTRATMASAAWCYFQFAAPFDLESGEKYFFGVQRQDGTGTSSCKIQFPVDSRPPGVDIEAREIALWTEKDLPAPGFDTGDSGEGSTLPIKFKYTRGIPIPVAGATVINMSAFFGGIQLDAEKLSTYVAATAFTLPVGLIGSEAFAEVVSTAAATIDLQVNGVSKGTIQFALGASVATYTFASPVGVVAGDRVQFIAQGTADATLADVSITIKGTI